MRKGMPRSANAGAKDSAMLSVRSVDAPSLMMYSKSVEVWPRMEAIVAAIYFSALKQTVMMANFFIVRLLLS